MIILLENIFEFSVWIFISLFMELFIDHGGGEWICFMLHDFLLQNIHLWAILLDFQVYFLGWEWLEILEIFVLGDFIHFLIDILFFYFYDPIHHLNHTSDTIFSWLRQIAWTWFKDINGNFLLNMPFSLVKSSILSWSIFMFSNSLGKYCCSLW